MQVIPCKMENFYEICMKLTKFDWLQFYFSDFCKNQRTFSVHVPQSTCNQIFVMVITDSFRGFFYCNP